MSQSYTSVSQKRKNIFSTGDSSLDKNLKTIPDKNMFAVLSLLEDRNTWLIHNDKYFSMPHQYWTF